MKHALLTLILLSTFGTQVQAAGHCSQTFLLAPLHLETAKQDRAQYIKDLNDMDIGDNAYVVRWKALNDETAGPLDKNGEFVAAYITNEKRAEWLEKVGNDSIGFIVGMNFENKLDFEGTAYLRIGSTVYPYPAIQHRDRYARSMVRLKDLNKSGAFTTQAGFVEATIKMTPEEIAVIKKFVESRLANKFAAQHEVMKRGYNPVLKHMVIMPEFDAEYMGLFKEGCAGACSSWAQADWQAHSADMRALQEITEKYGIVASPVARQLVWRNSRNPHVMGITILESSGWYAPSSFIREHNWANLRGMAVYGTIPDPIGPSKTVKSQRIPLKDWLNP